MEAEYDMFEVVAVTRGFWLVDAESYQRQYCTNRGHPLHRGYYVVNWPEHIRIRRFNEQAIFHGPYQSKQLALAAMDTMGQERKRRLAMRSCQALVDVPGRSRIRTKKAA